MKIYYLTLGVSFMFTAVGAQTSLNEGNMPELVLPVGHTEPILNIEFNDDNSLLLSSAGDKSILWNLKTGKPLRFFKYRNKADHCAVFCNEYIHVTGPVTNGEATWNIKNGKKENCVHGKRIVSMGSTLEKGNINLSDKKITIQSSKGMYRCEYNSNRMKLFNLNNQFVAGFSLTDGEIKPLDSNEDTSAVSHPAKGSIDISELLKGGGAEEIKAKLIAKTKENIDPRIQRINSASFSNDEKYIVVDFNRRPPILLSVPDLKLLKTYKPVNDNGDSLFTTKSAISNHSKQIVTFINGTIASIGSHSGYLFDLHSTKQLRELKAMAKNQPKITESNNRKTLMISGSSADFMKGVRFTGGSSRIFFNTYENKFYSDQYSDNFLIEKIKVLDKKYYFAVNRRGMNGFWDSFTGEKPGLTKEMLPDSGKTLNTLFYDDSKGIIDLLFNNGNYVVYDPVGNKIRSSSKLQPQAGAKDYAARYFVHSPDMKYIGFNGMNDHSVYVYDKDRKEIVYHYKFPDMAHSDEYIKFNSDNTGIWIWNKNSIFYLDNFLKPESITNLGNDPSRINLSDHMVSRDSALACIQRGKSFTIFDLKTKSEKGTFTVDGEVEFVDFGTDKVITSFEGMTNFYSISEMKKLFSLILLGEKDFMFLLPDFKYYGSRAAAEQLSFVHDLTMYSFEQFDIKYNRPDLVLKALRPDDRSNITELEMAYKNRLTRSGISEEMLNTSRNVPETSILNAAELNNTDTVDNGTLLIRSVFTDHNDLLKCAMVWVNGVPLYGKKGLPLEGHKAEVSIHVPLSTGENKISVSAMNRSLGESYRQDFFVYYSPKIKTSRTLYLIAVSVNIDAQDGKNSNTDLKPLKYTHKDGRDFVRLFKSRKLNSIYQKIVVDTLFEENATKKNIMALRSRLVNTTVDDEVLVLFSGHGEVNKALNEFYFINYDIDRKNPQFNGLAFFDIDALFDSIPARKRVVFLDACQSGEPDPIKSQSVEPGDNSPVDVKGREKAGVNPNRIAKIEFMKAIFNDVSVNSGTLVLSAASSTSNAKELDSKNGAFTKAIIEGLQNTEADRNPKDGKINLDELKDYLPGKVKQLSGNESTIRQDPFRSDWRIW